MTEFEMTQALSEKMNVTLEEARTALEAAQWNMLDAAVLIEHARAEQAQQNAQSAPEGAAAPEASRHIGVKGVLSAIGRGISKAVAFGNRNHLRVRRNGDILMDVPVTALALLLLFAFWVCVPLMIIGLFAGCHYSFTGRDLGRDDVNRAMEKASATAERVKEAVLQD